MSEPVLTATELLAWNERTTLTWRQLLEAHPEILQIPCDIYGVKTVAQVLQHIVAVETRFAERLAALPETSYDAIPCTTPAEIFAVHDLAMQQFRALLAGDIDWDSVMEFKTITMGPARASRKALFFHPLLHSIRHYAQLATLVRQHGFKPAFPMDYLMMGLTRVE